MKPGPRKTPTRLRVLKGETRPSRLNLHEPKFPEGEPALPETLSARAKPYWEFYVEHLRPARLLTQIDRDALAALCEHRAMHQQLLDLYWASSPLLTSRRNGSELVKNPLVAMIRNEAALCNAYDAKFGLTPSDRAGLVAPDGALSNLDRMLS